jgi:HSP20 family protein
MALIPWRRRDLVERRSEPEHALARFREEMDNLLESFFGGRWDIEPSHWPWGRMDFGVPLDVAETDTDITVKADLPGVDPKELDISVTGDTLFIRGEKKEETEEKGKHFQRVERRYGSFQRSVPLPSVVDADKIEASYKDGVLTIRMPKKEGAKPKQIPVKT